MKHKFLLAVVVLATFLLAACSMGGMMNGGNMAGMDHSNISSGSMSSTMAMTETMPMTSTMAGMDHGNIQMGNSNEPFDLLFIDSMIVHHQGAIGMAQSALTMSEHPELKSLAGNIIQAQEAEIAQMQEWQAAWEQ